jgi:hypothetical protein
VSQYPYVELVGQHGRRPEVVGLSTIGGLSW